MARPEIRPFDDEHLEAAAHLLAARHARHRATEPLLSPRYEEPPEARGELERTWRADGASGAAAFRDGRLVGYLVGASRANPPWGENTWVETAGHVVDEAEDARDLYGFAAARWIEQGRPRHYVLLPAHDPALLDAWWRVSFGQQHAHGVQPVSPPADTSVPDGFEIRAPRADEIELLIDLDLALPEHQARSPVFGGAHMYTREESRAEWEKALAGSDDKILIGAYGGRPVACWAYVLPVASSELTRGLFLPDDAIFLGFAATLPEFRGTGIGVALTNAGMAWAAAEGYRTMFTDWRVTNLLSSRFWPRRGFRTMFLRLYRAIP